MPPAPAPFREQLRAMRVAVASFRAAKNGDRPAVPLVLVQRPVYRAFGIDTEEAMGRWPPEHRALMSRIQAAIRRLAGWA